MPASTGPKKNLRLTAEINHDDYNVSVERVETPEERGARIEHEKAENAHKRLKDLIITISGIVFVGIILIGCLFLGLGSGATQEDKTWSKSILIAIVSGFLGYIGGRHSQPAPP